MLMLSLVEQALSLYLTDSIYFDKMSPKCVVFLLAFSACVVVESTCTGFSCTQGGQTYCGHIPCPHPPCSNPVTTPGECCPHCPGHSTVQRTAVFNTLNHGCPHPCNLNGHPTCVPPPCPPPACVDAETPHNECCFVCPNGPNCLIEGKLYPAFKNTTDHGKVCRCITFGPGGTGICR